MNTNSKLLDSNPDLNIWEFKPCLFLNVTYVEEAQLKIEAFCQKKIWEMYLISILVFKRGKFI